VVRTGWVERKLTAKELLLAWDLPATTINNALVVVGNRLSQEKMAPFKVRQSAATWRPYLCEGYCGRQAPVFEVRVCRRRSRVTDWGSNTEPVVKMAKEVVPPIDLNSDDRKARNQKATKADDAKVLEYVWDDRIA
jgi:hypothetical protein